jgi:hypothetical protein
MPSRKHDRIATWVDPDVKRALVKRARKTGKSYRQIIEDLIRRSAARSNG